MTATLRSLGVQDGVRRAGSGTGPLSHVRPGGRAFNDFIHEQEPPKEWVDLLRSVSPKSDIHGYLYLAWLPGEWWVPGQRWGLYEMLHPDFVSFDIMEELEGPHPRSAGHYCSKYAKHQYQCLCRDKMEAWRGGPCMLVTKVQWELFRKTGYVARHLFWTIQGKGGGNKAFFTEEEEGILAQAGKSQDPIPVAKRPYAPFDMRVVKHIERHNALRKFGNDLNLYRRRMGKEYPLEVAAAQKRFRESVLKWFDDQTEDNQAWVDIANDVADDNNIAADTTDWVRVMAESEESYVEKGVLTHPSRVK